MPVFCDDMLAVDPATGRVDLAFDGTNLVMDTTAQTAMILAVGCDRRARADDKVADVGNAYAPSTLVARRGTPLDALDTLGRLFGSRMWLLARRKQTEATRRFAESALQECAAPIAAMGVPVTIKVRWVRYQVLGWQMAAGPVQLSHNLAVG